MSTQIDHISCHHHVLHARGLGQGHMHHEALLIIIILNVVLQPFDDDIIQGRLYTIVL